VIVDSKQQRVLEAFRNQKPRRCNGRGDEQGGPDESDRVVRAFFMTIIKFRFQPSRPFG
jgi:hypothetical protein